ncbi:RPM1-interacting protein 4-like isoform X2 [Aristolochia californica]|uniref:RPM1-interacting protein 4-like isoform X2 n=1 Tax=Aristolochia californica TaxID=171875 RepID=UPI0035D9A539
MAENPDAFSEDMPHGRAPPVRSAPNIDSPLQASLAAARPMHEGHSSREEGEFKKFTASPGPPDGGVRKVFTDPPHSRGVNSSDSHRRGRRISGGSDRSIEQSPLHPHYQAKTPSRGGVSSPSRDKRGPHEGSHGLGPSTPGRSRLRSVETTEKDAAVPKFGDWNEMDPASADGYTHIFNKVREEKQTGAAKFPAVPTDSSYSNSRNHDNPDNPEPTWYCCFWGSRK